MILNRYIYHCVILVWRILFLISIYHHILSEKWIHLIFGLVRCVWRYFHTFYSNKISILSEFSYFFTTISKMMNLFFIESNLLFFSCFVLVINNIYYSIYIVIQEKKETKIWTKEEWFMTCCNQYKYMYHECVKHFFLFTCIVLYWFYFRSNGSHKNFEWFFTFRIDRCNDTFSTIIQYTHDDILTVLCLPLTSFDQKLLFTFIDFVVHFFLFRLLILHHISILLSTAYAHSCFEK